MLGNQSHAAVWYKIFISGVVGVLNVCIRSVFIQTIFIPRRRGRVWRLANRYVVRKFVSLEIFSVPAHHHHHHRRCRRRRRPRWCSPSVLPPPFVDPRRAEWQRRFGCAKAITFWCQVLKITAPLARVRVGSRLVREACGCRPRWHSVSKLSFYKNLICLIVLPFLFLPAIWTPFVHMSAVE